MHPTKPYDSVLRTISIAILAALLLSFVLEIALPEWRVTIGIASRFVLAGFCLVSAYLLFRGRRPLAVSVLLLVVGIGLIVTALLGYSINGTAPVPWLQP